MRISFGGVSDLTVEPFQILLVKWLEVHPSALSPATISLYALWFR